MRNAGIAIVYLLLISATVLVAFVPWLGVPVSVGYILLTAVFIFPIVVSVLYNFHSILLGSICVISPLLAMLIVVDPVELGLYGYDPYSITLPAYRSFILTDDLSSFIRDTESWPAFYAFFAVVVQLTGVETLTAAKFIPLLGATAPVLLFVGALRVMNSRAAFLAAIGFGSTRTLLLFESKFIDEALAVILFCSLILVLIIYIEEESKQLLLMSTIIIFSVVLTHHSIGLFSVTYILVAYASHRFVNLNLSPSRLHTTDEQFDVPILVAIAGGLGLVLIFIFLSVELTGGLVVSLLQSLLSGSGGEVAGVGSGNSSLRGYIATSATGILAVFALINAFSVFRSKNMPPWIIAWTGYAAIIGAAYVYSLAFGRTVPLDPIRFLIVFVPVLVLPTMGAVSMETQFDSVQSKLTIGVVILISLLVVTQLAAMPPHVLYSDKDRTSLSEGHFTPSQFKSSQWASKYVDGGIMAYERDLWTANNNTNVRLHDSQVGVSEPQVTVWRKEGSSPRPTKQSVIYSSSGIKLFTE